MISLNNYKAASHIDNLIKEAEAAGVPESQGATQQSAEGNIIIKDFPKYTYKYVESGDYFETVTDILNNGESVGKKYGPGSYGYRWLISKGSGHGPNAAQGTQGLNTARSKQQARQKSGREEDDSAFFASITQTLSQAGGGQSASGESQGSGGQSASGESQGSGGSTPQAPTSRPISAYKQDKQQNIRTIEEVFASKGYPIQMARAAITNARAESNFDNTAVGDQGRSVGLFQLNIQGAGAGMSVEERMDPVKNTERIIETMQRVWNKTESGHESLASALARGASIAELAGLFCIYVERPANRERQLLYRQELARQLFGAEADKTYAPSQA